MNEFQQRMWKVIDSIDLKIEKLQHQLGYGPTGPRGRLILTNEEIVAMAERAERSLKSLQERLEVREPTKEQLSKLEAWENKY